MPFQIIVKTLQGLEDVLARELHALGASQVTVLKRAVAFRGDTEMLYAANIHLRTALRVLKPVHAFHAADEDMLYKKVKEFDWTTLFDPHQTFAIDTTIYSDRYLNTQYPALKMKDAIADRFRDECGRRPSVDKENADVRLNLHMQGDHVTISLDSSGESLHKRGYRPLKHEAPMSEVLAAGLIMLSGWDKKQPLYDPMCGSGTIPIEAALMAVQMSPGLIRKDYAFKHWKDYDQGLYKRLILQAAAEVKKTGAEIAGSDISPQAIDIALENMTAAKLDGQITFFVKDFQQSEPPPEKGLMIINPPYGERLKPEHIIDLYGQIGTTLKHKYPGWSAWIFSSNMEAIKHVGLKPAVKLRLKNGPLDCVFNRYDMMEGRFSRHSVASE